MAPPTTTVQPISANQASAPTNPNTRTIPATVGDSIASLSGIVLPQPVFDHKGLENFYLAMQGYAKGLTTLEEKCELFARVFYDIASHAVDSTKQSCYSRILAIGDIWIIAWQGALLESQNQSRWSLLLVELYLDHAKELKQELDEVDIFVAELPLTKKITPAQLESLITAKISREKQNRSPDIESESLNILHNYFDELIHSLEYNYSANLADIDTHLRAATARVFRLCSLICDKSNDLQTKPLPRIVRQSYEANLNTLAKKLAEADTIVISILTITSLEKARLKGENYYLHQQLEQSKQAIADLQKASAASGASFFVERASAPEGVTLPPNVSVRL
jgi:hypothetical protein